MKSRFFAMLAVLLFSVQSGTAQDASIRLAATEFPPFYGEELDENGFVTVIIREAFSRAGYEPEVIFMPWTRALEGTREGRYDGLFTVWYRRDREADFIFSDPLPANELVLIARAGDEFTFDGLETLQGMRIGMVRGYALPPDLEEAGLKVSESRDDEEALRVLLRGRIDVILTDRIVAQHIINTRMPADTESFSVISPPVHIDPQYLVVPRAIEGSDALMARFNEALGIMEEDGTLAGIVADYGF